MPKIQTPQTLTGLAKMLARDGRRVSMAPDPETARQLSGRAVINLGGVPGLSDVAVRGRKVILGAGATFGRVLRDIRGENGLVRQAISMMANPLVRNRTTVMESLGPESPYFDLATALLALDSRVRLQGTGGSRVLPIAEYLLAAAGDLKAGDFPAAVEFTSLSDDTCVGFFRVNPGRNRNTVSAAVVTRLRRNVAVDPKLYVSSSTTIPLYAAAASAVMSRSLLNDHNLKMVAEAAAVEMLELAGVDSNPYESSLIEVAVSRAIRRLNESPAPG